MPATVTVTAYPAEFRRATANIVMVTQSLASSPLAKRTDLCSNMGHVQDLFDAVVKEAKATGFGFVASCRVVDGRKPVGFDKARLRLEWDPHAATR